MPSKEAHLAAARSNEATLRYLLAGGDEHLGWVASVAFYEALHIVEAVLAGDPHATVHHTDDHKLRNKHLKSTNRYAQLWKMYRPLWEASLIARYLREDSGSPTHEVFTTYMPRQTVEQLLLGHYLVQLKKAAARLLDEPGLFDPQPPTA